MPIIAVTTLDLDKKIEIISPLLFSPNLEHTRSCVWQRLNAQLLRNHKLFGKSQCNGVVWNVCRYR